VGGEHVTISTPGGIFGMEFRPRGDHLDEHFHDAALALGVNVMHAVASTLLVTAEGQPIAPRQVYVRRYGPAEEQAPTPSRMRAGVLRVMYSGSQPSPPLTFWSLTANQLRKARNNSSDAIAYASLSAVDEALGKTALFDQPGQAYRSGRIPVHRELAFEQITDIPKGRHWAVPRSVGGYLQQVYDTADVIFGIVSGGAPFPRLRPTWAEPIDTSVRVRYVDP